LVTVRIYLYHPALHDRFHPRLATVRHDTDGPEHMRNFPGSNYRSYDVWTGEPNWFLAAKVAVRDIQMLAISGIERCTDAEDIVIW